MFLETADALEGRQLFRHQVNGVTNYLLLTKLNQALARLTGSDVNGNEQPLPPGYTIVVTFGFPMPPNPMNGMFVIMWSDSYVVSFGGVHVLSLTNQRQQARHFNNSVQDISATLILPAMVLNLAPAAGFVEAPEAAEDDVLME
ncbi:hypothetical protein BASA81_000393 [Batrachochytrium salamandrivorans]|nr:hypothetical protein BASA81_000393 [Batrachochytrium salamandrivorans]